MQRIYVITGGTIVHISPHFALCAPAFGNVGEDIYRQLKELIELNHSNVEVYLIRTRMAGPNSPDTQQHLRMLDAPQLPETNDDLKILVRALVDAPETAALVMSAAVCDFQPTQMIVEDEQHSSPKTVTAFGKDQPRLHHAHKLSLTLLPDEKIIDDIKQKRPDILLATFKTTAGLLNEEIIMRATWNLHKSQSDFVVANDVHNHTNLLMDASERHIVGKSRSEILQILSEQLFAGVLSK